LHQSLLTQTIKNAIYFVNDGSTDRVKLLVISTKDSRIVIITQINKINHARNGNSAVGTYLNLLADDYLETNFFKYKPAITTNAGGISILIWN
jgi:glycosyltransferase involved in cell wall biosynthesis